MKTFNPRVREIPVPTNHATLTLPTAQDTPLHFSTIRKTYDPYATKKLKTFDLTQKILEYPIVENQAPKTRT
jgi:hypothetical protein